MNPYESPPLSSTPTEPWPLWRTWPLNLLKACFVVVTSILLAPVLLAAALGDWRYGCCWSAPWSVAWLVCGLQLVWTFILAGLFRWSVFP